MPLKISLKPDEVVVINGAMLRNGHRRGTILLENNAAVIRERDSVPECDRELSHQHEIAYLLFLYASGQRVPRRRVVARFRSKLQDAFPDLPFAEEFAKVDAFNTVNDNKTDLWFSTYKLVREELYPKKQT